MSKVFKCNIYSLINDRVSSFSRNWWMQLVLSDDGLNLVRRYSFRRLECCLWHAQNCWIDVFGAVYKYLHVFLIINETAFGERLGRTRIYKEFFLNIKRYTLDEKGVFCNVNDGKILNILFVSVFFTNQPCWQWNFFCFFDNYPKEKCRKHFLP